MNILITGGTGFIGTQLIQHLKRDQHTIIILSRRPDKLSDSSIQSIKRLNELKGDKIIDVIVNLAGTPIDKRWTKSYKKRLIESRVRLTQDLVDWIALQSKKPNVFISASAIGFYGSQGKTPLDEESDAHDEFTHQLCKQWETAALNAQKLGVRTCITRLGVVLGESGGALKKMLPSFKLGLGSSLGDGQQFFSWIHIKDVCRAICFLIDNNHLEGAFNLTSPNPVTNKQFTQTLSKVLHRSAYFSMPKFIIKLLFGEMGTTLLLEGKNIMPKRLKEERFEFLYSNLEKALIQLLPSKHHEHSDSRR